jgi:ATP-dependent DNA helicase RecG
VVARIADEVARGRQVYWVCPLIDEAEEDAADDPPSPSASRGKPLSELSNVIETHAALSAALPLSSVGLVHGKLKSAEKAEVMARFVSGQINVLVATTVIEVGVDVPNASLMVIEHAERFGLSQLHQLRGRVGRGETASVCVLLYSPPLSATGKPRIKAMLDTTDGFEIARRDLAIRGPGEFFGERQSGVALLRFADLQLDEAWISQARRAAEQLLKTDPQVAARHVNRWLGGKTELWMA